MKNVRAMNHSSQLIEVLATHRDGGNALNGSLFLC
jgi:hypothetical protein